MSLRLILGRAGSGKTHTCLEEIRERLLKAPEGPPLILLLPEHATFQVERELAATPGLGGFARVYIFGFRRLAHRVLLETGGAVRPHISELGKRLVLSRLMQQHQGELKMFHRVASQRTFAETLAGMIQEFKTYDISPEQLSQAVSSLERSPLADKLHDLALLYQEFTGFLAGRYTDPEDYLTLLADKIPQSALIQGAEVWVDGFTWFNPQELAVLAKIMQTAASVNVTLCLADADGSQHQSETALFHRQWQTRRKLKELAQSVKAEVCEIELAESRRFGPLLGHIEKEFFTFPPPAFSGDMQGLSITEAANRRIEVEGIARDIIRLSRQEGYRWRDIAILLRDDASYGELVSTILTDYDIPFFSDQHIQPVHHPLAELIRSALETVAGRWNYDAVFRCFKTDLFMVSRNEIDELENYVLEFGIRGSRWKDNRPWAFVRRFSLDEDAELSLGQISYLTRINDIRNQAAAPLIAFESELKAAATAAEMTTALYNFLAGLNVPRTLEKWADAAEADGDLEQAREHRQIWNSVIELFDQLVEACGEDELKLDDYSAIINDGLEGLKLSLIPPGLDHVTVSPLDQTSLANVRAVYLPGVNDGILPMRARGEGLLTDAERLKLAADGLELAPGALADTFAERFMIYTALTRAKDYLWVSYALADEEGKGLSPSLVIDRLKELSGIKVKSLPLEPQPGTEQEYIAHRRSSLSALAASLRLYKSGQELSDSWWEVYNWAVGHDAVKPLLSRSLAGLFHHNQEPSLPAELATKLYGPSKKLRGSVTRFESFRACPFRHFSQYGLSLKERVIFRLNAPDLGQFLHTALKNFGDKMQADGRDWGAVSDSEYRAICTEIVEELAPKLQNEILLSSEQHRNLLKRLTNTVERSVRRLVEFDRASQFKPRALEKPFGRGDAALPPLVYKLPDGTDLEIVGQIDRLDTAEYNNRQYILVIDYKSGGAWLKLVDVYHGLKLQLLTYLLVAKSAAEELLGTAECEPAGVLYYFLKNPTITSKNALSEEEVAKEINSQLRMPGWTLADPEIAKAIDKTLDPKSEFLKLTLKKDGSFYGNCQAYIKTAKEFTLLLSHVEDVLVETAQNIMAGDITISPYALDRRSPCGICNYKPVCQFDLLLPENDYRKLPHYADDIIIKTLAEKKGGGQT